MRFAGIVGRRFCGSTIFARAMAAVPGVASVGELHWLLDTKGQEMSRCSPCGIDCEVFTPPFRKGPLNRKTLYETVLKHHGGEVLLSADKTPWQYERFLQPHTMHGIMLFRDPLGAVASDLRRGIYANPKSGDAARWALLGWLEFYHGLDLWMGTFCKSWIVLSYYDFVDDPWGTVRAVCRRFYWNDPVIPESLADLKYHHIGGGTGHDYDMIRHDDRWRDQLTTEQVNIIQDDFRAQTLHSALIGSRMRIVP